VVNVRVAPEEQPVAPGDCAEAMRRAVAKPDLVVDRIPAPVVAKPPALQKLPKAALRKDGSAEVKVDVLIDTLGKADMKTFKVVTTSSPLLVDNVKSVIGKWKFSPAELAGCKIPRVFHFMASAPPRGKPAS
jgi:outer membrane biosynthesis protein TonB